MDSISPDACAAAKVTPLPCETATERALGRYTATTGIPIRSRPVKLAMRVMPINPIHVFIRATVSVGEVVRWVSCRKALGTFGAMPGRMDVERVIVFPLSRKFDQVVVMTHLI